jgi:hypothetical protein
MSTTITQKTEFHTPEVFQDPHQYDYSRLKPYVHPPETKEDLPWAELVTLDLEDYARPGGKEQLAKQLEHAVHDVGFFYVKNFGLTQDQVDQQFTLAKNFFELPVEEKEKYELKYSEADYNGWRRPGRSLQAKAFDNVEIFNIPKYGLLLLLSKSALAHSTLRNRWSLYVDGLIANHPADLQTTFWENVSIRIFSRPTSTRLNFSNALFMPTLSYRSCGSSPSSCNCRMRSILSSSILTRRRVRTITDICSTIHGLKNNGPTVTTANKVDILISAP